MTVWDWADRHWLLAMLVVVFGSFWLGLLALAGVARLLSGVAKERPVTINLQAGDAEPERIEPEGRPS